MNTQILYCGDTHLRNAAAYLGGVLTSGGLAFRYVPSDRPLAPSDLAGELQLLILSDYPAARVAGDQQRHIAERVAAGMGLLMIGGWESFHGAGGDWDQAPLADLLPVTISSTDDRLNSDQPLLVRRTHKHPVTRGLPWKRTPPHVGGLNRVQPRQEATVVLEADRLAARRKRCGWRFKIHETHPILVIGRHGQGRTAALMTDLAPHWVGGMVDWGDARVAAQAPAAEAVEVGNWYARFVLQLIRWTMRAEPDPDR